MKTKLILILTVLCGFTNAQPVITDANNLPPVGDTGSFYVGIAASPGNSGPNQLWDFSGTTVSKAGQWIYLDPASTPFFSYFPTANGCMLIDSMGGYPGSGMYSGYNYAIKTSTYCAELSYQFWVPSDTCPHRLIQPLVDLVFPFYYTDSASYPFQADCTPPMVFSLKIKYDGYGILKTPLGKTYNNVVRVEMTQTFPFPPYVNTLYYWWTLDPLAIPCYYAKDNLNDSIAKFTFFDYSLVTTVNDIYKANSYINIFPNPFYMQTTLQTSNLLHNATLTVYNSYGQTVKQIRNISGQTINFHRDNLPSGMYIILLTEENKTISADKLVIID